jgi:hypothetical protein
MYPKEIQEVPEIIPSVIEIGQPGRKAPEVPGHVAMVLSL